MIKYIKNPVKKEIKRIQDKFATAFDVASIRTKPVGPKLQCPIVYPEKIYGMEDKIKKQNF